MSASGCHGHHCWQSRSVQSHASCSLVITDRRRGTHIVTIRAFYWRARNGFRDFTKLSFSLSFLCSPLSFGAPRCGRGSFLGSYSRFLLLLISTIHHDSQTDDTQDPRLSTPTFYTYTSLLIFLLDRYPSFYRFYVFGSWIGAVSYPGHTGGFFIFFYYFFFIY